MERSGYVILLFYGDVYSSELRYIQVNQRLTSTLDPANGLAKKSIMQEQRRQSEARIEGVVERMVENAHANTEAETETADMPADGAAVADVFQRAVDVLNMSSGN